MWFEDATRPLLTPPAPPWNQVSVALLTQTPLRATSARPELSPCVPPCCPTAGTSVVPLVPLARCLGKLFQRLLGHMASTAAVTLLGLLHMRPLQCWLHGRVPRWAWQSGIHRVFITPCCRQTFSQWSDPSFLWAGVPLEQVSRHAVVFTEFSATGWGATYNRHAVRGLDRTQTALTLGQNTKLQDLIPALCLL